MFHQERSSTSKKSSPVMLLGRPDDPHLIALAETLSAHDVPLLLLNSREPVDLSISLREREVTIAQQSPRALFVRHLPPRVPGFATTAPLGRPERHKTLMEGLSLREAWTLALTVLGERDVPLINGAHAFSVDQHKLRQLLVAATLGLNVPASVVQRGKTSKEGAFVYKPLLNGEVRDAPLSDDELHLVQSFIPGTPARLTMLDGVVLSSVRLENVEGVDHRSSASYRRGEVAYSKVSPPAGVVAKLRAMAKRLGLRFHGSDFMLCEERPASESCWHFLEMNPMPAWLEIEAKTGAEITAALALALMRAL